MKKSYRNFAFGSAIVVGVGVLVFLGTQFSSWRDQLAQVGGQAFRITAIVLYNTATGQDIATLTNGMVIDTAQTGVDIGFRAETTTDVEMVYFTITPAPSGPYGSYVDTSAPYQFGETVTARALITASGAHTIRAIPYSADSAPWTQGQTVLLNYTIGTVNTPTYALTVTKEGSGTITGPGFNCGTDCSEVFSEGAMAEVTAVPASGSVFLRWNGICSEAGATCRLPMTANETAHAVFQTTTTTDTTPPTVSLTAPASGSVLGTSTTVSASATDNVGVVGVKFFSNGQLINTEDTVSPYETVWNTSVLTPGTYTLTAIARDQAGNTTTSPGRAVSKSAPNDTTPPTVSLTAPGNGSTVSGTVTVSATASDAGSGVSGVQFKMDGQNIGSEDVTAPYAVSWDTTTTSNGSHTLTAVARDSVGNTATSSAQTVTVNNQIVLGSKISITSDMVANALRGGDHFALFDGDTNTTWRPPADAQAVMRSHQVAVIDLGKPYALSEVRYFKKAKYNNPDRSITVRSCRKKTWAEAQSETSKHNPLLCSDLFTDTLSDNSSGWVSRPVTMNTSARYFEIALNGGRTALEAEVELYGTGNGSMGNLFEGISTSSNTQYPLMDDFIGINAFNNNPPGEIATVAGHERDYVVMSWLNGGDYDPTTNPGTLHPVGAHQQLWCNAGFLCPDAMRFQPSAGFPFDDNYLAFKNAGLKVFPAFKESIRGGFSSSRNSVPVPAYDNTIPGYNNNPSNQTAQEENPFNPYSYRAAGEIFYQVAARYGGRQVPTNSLKLRSGQVSRTGLGYIDAIEMGNEEGKTWEDPKAWHSPYMEAVRSSALYDGHMDTIIEPGKSTSYVGVKNADPNLRVSIAGLFDVTNSPGQPDLGKSMLNLVRLWSSVYRNGSMPFDIINVHHYTKKNSTYDRNGDGVVTNKDQEGISPEEGRLREFAERLVAYAKSNWSGMPVWVTEFGYDTGANGSGAQAAPAYGPYSVQQVQAMWIIRSYLELVPTRVQRASLFMFPDSCAQALCDSAGQYSTSGVVGSIPGNFLPKKVSFYWLATFKSVLSGTRFTRDLSNSSVRNYEFKNDAGMKTVNVIWSPTANGASVTGYQAGGAGTLIRLSDTSTTGTSTAFAGGSLVVTEVPVFIVR